MKFYKHADGYFVIDNQIIPSGTCRLVFSDTTVKAVSIQTNKDVIENTLITSLEKENGTSYSSLSDLLTDIGNFFVNAAQVAADGVTSLKNRAGIGLDFLFVNQWDADTSILPTALNQSLMVYDGDVTNVIAQYKSVTDGEVFAWEEIITPISQTTIFVHPTTFERYRFNGAAMVVYDDVDYVVPKWLKYEALLTQTGENAPVARVLNQDERDYLGDIVYERVSAGIYKSILKAYKPNITSATLQGSLAAKINSVIYNDEDNNGFFIQTLQFDTDGFVAFDDAISAAAFSIKQRVRGNPPKLLTAETNIAGDKVILTFDKEMSEYGLANAIVDMGGLYFLKNGAVNSAITCTLNKTFVEIGVQETLLFGDLITVKFDSDGIESRDYGLLQPFENFPVVNKVMPD